MGFFSAEAEGNQGANERSLTQGELKQDTNKLINKGKGLMVTKGDELETQETETKK